MTDRKPRPLWPLLTAALIGLPVLYVLSMGPWIAIRGRLPDEDSWIAVTVTVDRFFIGPQWLLCDAPKWLGNPYHRYVQLWADPMWLQRIWWERND